MPTSDYHCDHCGPMEIFQSIKDDTLKRCPECGSRKFRKQISSGAGIIFKGDGFWETDYNRSQQYQQQAKQESGASVSPAVSSQESSGSSGAKSDSSVSTTSSGSSEQST